MKGECNDVGKTHVFLQIASKSEQEVGPRLVQHTTHYLCALPIINDSVWATLKKWCN